MHGTRARVRPGVPRLPPGASCVGYAHANPNAKLENPHQQTNDAASRQPGTTVRDRCDRGTGPVNVPRSPGWKPGDSGHEHHPAVHASRPHVTPRFEPAMHGTRARVRPGVPRLPPGASCVGYAHANPNAKLENPHQQTNDAASRQPGTTVRDRCDRGTGPVNVPRSPGWKPGDSGHEHHPAVHASRPHVTPRFEPAMHGTRARVRPGVPRLPPGASCVGYAHANPNANWKTRTSKRTTRLPSNRARRSETGAPGGTTVRDCRSRGHDGRRPASQPDATVAPAPNPGGPTARCASFMRTFRVFLPL